MGVDIQRGGGLVVDIELLRQAVLFQDALEPPCEGGGRHRQARALSAEEKVISGQFSFVVGLSEQIHIKGLACVRMPVLFAWIY